ncbi:MAG: hypothetical protein MSIBF_05535 [Candidatus Altiarchaeales archaeon IMC4]|nr:MAG: hypothetical protein MSIBF_05535 [Candidatus Altiarchaeales archaeon IMC4]
MQVKIIRSARRRRTISAREVGGVIHLFIPAWTGQAEEQKHVEWARKKMDAKRRRRELKEKNADACIEKLAQKLNKEYFDGQLRWSEITYSTQQNSHMFGNCHPRAGIIRLSDRLLKMPKFVHDYVVMHELAHLKRRGHDKKFWDIVNRYPKTERARGYLMAVGLED